MYQFVNIHDIMLFPAERRRNFPLISYICLQHVDGNFQRHFFKIFLKIPMIFAFAFKTSVKLFIDSLSLFARCRWKFLSTSFYLLRKSMIFCFCYEIFVGGKFRQYFADLFPKCRWKWESVNQNRICKVSVKYVGYWINLQKTNSF